MLPTLAIIGFGRRNLWLPIPIPLFVLWPLVVALVGVVSMVPDHRLTRPLRHALLIVGSLSGLRVDVVNAGKHRFLFWIV